MSDDQEKTDQEQVRAIRQELAKGGDKAVERRYGPKVKGSAEYAEALRQRRRAQTRTRLQHQRERARRSPRTSEPSPQVGGGAEQSAYTVEV